MGIVCRLQIIISKSPFAQFARTKRGALYNNVKRMNEQRDLYKSEWRSFANIILIMPLP